MSARKHRHYTNYAAYAYGRKNDNVRYTDATGYGFEEHESYVRVASIANRKQIA